MSGVPQRYEPRTMHHPQFRKGKITEIKGLDKDSGRPFTDYQGEADTFPDVTVKDATTEAYYRSRGYLMPGEVPPPPAEYSEYPVMMIHPDHVDAVLDSFTIEKAENGEIIRHRIPGTPEKFPHRVAHSAAEEKKYAADGYARPGQSDPDAMRSAKASPYKGKRKVQEYPKMVDGKVVATDRPVEDPNEYPKWVGDKIVKSRAEEEALTGKKAEATVWENCVICGEGIDPQDGKGRGAKGAFHMAHFQTNSTPAAKRGPFITGEVNEALTPPTVGKAVSETAKEPKKRVRRTKAQIEADNLAASKGKKEKPAKVKDHAGE